MRFNVTARNSRRVDDASSSGESAVVTEPLPSGAIKLPSGEIVDSRRRACPRTSRLDRLAGAVLAEPGDEPELRSPCRVRVKDTRGFVVRDALVVRPLDAEGDLGRRPPERRRSTAGSRTSSCRTGTSRSPGSGYSVQFFVKAYRSGDPGLGGIAGYRLVQVRLAGWMPRRVGADDRPRSGRLRDLATGMSALADVSSVSRAPRARPSAGRGRARGARAARR